MNFSIQDVKRLVPEAHVVGDDVTDIQVLLNGFWFVVGEDSTFDLLLEARYKLEKMNSILNELANYKSGEDFFGFLDAVLYRGTIAEAIEIIGGKNEH